MIKSRDEYSRKWFTLAATGMGIFLCTVDGSIVNGTFDLESYEFTRDPLMVDINDGQRTVRIINIHLNRNIHHAENFMEQSSNQTCLYSGCG